MYAKQKVKHLSESESVSRSVMSDSVTPWTVACQAPLSMEFSRQKHRHWLPFLSPGDLPDPGMEARSPALQADSLPSEPPGKPLAAAAAKSLQSCLTLCDPMDYSHSLGKNTRVGCHSLLRGIFSTRGLNQGLLHYRQIL